MAEVWPALVDRCGAPLCPSRAMSVPGGRHPGNPLFGQTQRGRARCPYLFSPVLASLAPSGPIGGEGTLYTYKSHTNTPAGEALFAPWLNRRTGTRRNRNLADTGDGFGSAAPAASERLSLQGLLTPGRAGWRKRDAPRAGAGISCAKGEVCLVAVLNFKASSTMTSLCFSGCR
jgi:hypothetical protein